VIVRGAAIRLLIFGGTGDAFRLAETAARRPEFEVTTSFAGRTSRPRLPPGRVRIGGFGGREGLRDYLVRGDTNAVIDATHPFAARISANVRDACAAAGRPLLILERPPWPADAAKSGDNIVEALAIAGRATGRILITFNPEDPADLQRIPGSRLVVRSLHVPKRLPRGASWLPFRPTATVEEESRILEKFRIGAIVTKASGGTATAVKLKAAAARGLPVVFIRRPEPPAGGASDDPEDALVWALREGARASSA
jgi:precorrin-6A/cobalt-precorrin-6A reductase